MLVWSFGFPKVNKSLRSTEPNLSVHLYISLLTGISIHWND